MSWKCCVYSANPPKLPSLVTKFTFCFHLPRIPILSPFSVTWILSNLDPEQNTHDRKLTRFATRMLGTHIQSPRPRLPLSTVPPLSRLQAIPPHHQSPLTLCQTLRPNTPPNPTSYSPQIPMPQRNKPLWLRRRLEPSSSSNCHIWVEPPITRHLIPTNFTRKWIKSVLLQNDEPDVIELLQSRILTGHWSNSDSRVVSYATWAWR